MSAAPLWCALDSGNGRALASIGQKGGEAPQTSRQALIRAIRGVRAVFRTVSTSGQ
jgi:hypothetical protein